MTNNAHEILPLIRDRCFCQHSDSSIVMPRNLQELARIRVLPMIDSLCWSRFWNLEAGWINMSCILVALRDNLFAQNQLKIASRLRFALLNKLIGLESDRKTVVSSANDTIFSVVQLNMSFIYMRKRSGPRIEPWDTPQRTDSLIYTWESISTYWVLGQPSYTINIKFVEQYLSANGIKGLT